jgi:hypothetical protein
VQTCATDGAGLEDIKRWLRELIPGAPAPRTLEAWELPEPIPVL